MTIKSLFLGSAAALVAVSGARAADAVVIPEPELVEYVRVCDTYGTGFFYIPGTETCLAIGGYVRYEMNLSSQDWAFTDADFDGDADTDDNTVVEALSAFAEAGGDIRTVDLDQVNADFGPLVEAADNDGYGKRSEIRVNIDARNETALGTLRSYIRLGYDTNPRSGTDINVEHAYIQLAGLTIGKNASTWDWGFGADADALVNFGPGNVGMVRYTANAGGFAFSLALEADETADFTPDVVLDVNGAIGDIAMQAGIAYNESAEAFTGKIYGAYDFGVATLGLGYQYSEEASLGAEYLSQFEHVIGADISADLTEKLAARAGVNYGLNWFGTDADVVVVGAGVSYNLVEGFNIDARVQHQMFDSTLEAVGLEDYTTGRIRFTRSF